MSEKVDVNKKIDELEAATKKYASKDTVVSIGGYEFTPAKLMIAFTIVSSILGGLYGAFEIYKSYQDMKTKIEKYVAPDLTEIYKKMEVLDANTSKMTEYSNSKKYVAPDLTEIYKKMEVLEANTSKMTEYSNSIKNDLKQDVRRLESVVENIERSSKMDQRSTDATVKDIKKDVDTTLKEVRRFTDQSVKEISPITEIRALRGEVDMKIKKALDNPLAN